MNGSPAAPILGYLRADGRKGVRNIIVSQFVSDQRQWMRTFADEVLPAFR